MMSQCMVPNWKERRQRQEPVVVVVGGGEGNRSSHVQYYSQSQIQPHHQHHYQNSTVPIMPNYEVAELTWQNGQLAMNGLSSGGLLPTGPTKPTWNRAGDTLESVVHQATWPNQNLYPPLPKRDHNPANVSSAVGSTIVKRAETLGRMHVGPKRVRSETDQCGGSFGSSIQEERSACAAAASATFCKENDATMVTWASFESPRNLKTKTTDEDSAGDLDGSENLEDQERETTKGETGRSHSTRRSRAAAVHNQSERKRRDRINQKMRALQKLVPNASKTDKASMLDEVIEYLKQLQAQVHLMSSATRNNMPQMMTPAALGLHHQQQIQMSLLARMGMGMGVGFGMGMGPTFLPPPHPFVVPPMIPNHNLSQATTDAAAVRSSVPFNNPYCTFLGQPINMDLYNKMAAIYQQQVNHTSLQTSSPFPSTHVQGGKEHLT
ncbi:hypothetical protein RHGRI_034795 [Rhododendron griersonianum]|uniref:BHLH domain-containing protein n=1 Tax=Rhododendron griersonianum TaxID=479676 RepID=A0AAV6I5F3_9ERIC|nr:hypothetical protein RHGRI_034795 [Rhododendron griersonianum]